MSHLDHSKRSMDAPRVQEEETEVIEEEEMEIEDQEEEEEEEGEEEEEEEEAMDSFLRSPSPTISTFKSPQIEPLNLNANHSSLSLTVVPMNSTPYAREWSEGVRQLIMETDQAFEFGGSSLGGFSTSLDLPRFEESVFLDGHLNISNPELVSPRLMVHPPQDESESEEEEQEEDEEEEEEEVVVEEEPIEPQQPPVEEKQPEEPEEEARPSQDLPARIPGEQAIPDLAERRKSRSVPPPIAVRKASLDKALPITPTTVLTPTTQKHLLNVSHNMTPPLPKPSKMSPRLPRIGRHESTMKKGHTRNKSGSGEGKSWARPVTSKVARWALPDNMTDLFTGKGFRKVEVDEMLTPQQLALLKKEREMVRRKQIAKNNKECHEAVKRETLAKLELEAAAAKAAALREQDAREATALAIANASIVTPELSPQSFGSPAGSDQPAQFAVSPLLSSDYIQDNANIAHVLGDESDRGLATVDLLAVPEGAEAELIAPLRAPPTQKLPDLPKGAKLKRKFSDEFLPEEDEDHIYLKSTPFSLTLPAFRHGRIALPKADKAAVTMDETLDWTAFQMAILGAGDMDSDMFEDEDIRLTEEIASWFDHFGFEHAGMLIPELIPSPRSSHSTISSVESEGDLSIASVDEPQPLFSHPDASQFDSTKFFRSTGLRSWTLDGAPKMNRASTPPPMALMHADPKQGIASPRSVVSPRSPMEPLVLGGDDGDVLDDDLHHEEQAQMGYNLHNDLGDFLQWEAQAFGVGYYGAH